MSTYTNRVRHLLQSAATELEREAEGTRGACKLGPKLWACKDCDPITCSMRKTHAKMSRIAKRLRAEADAKP